MSTPGPSDADRKRFDEGLQRRIGEIYRDRGDRFADHRDRHGWVTGYLGDPFAPVWFVAENPSLTAVENVGDAEPTADRQWTITPGDKLFREMLLQHGFKQGSVLSPGGWRCYITDVIKATAFVKDNNRQPASRFLNAAEAWAPALRWELENGRPVVVVSVGDKARRALNHLIKTRHIPQIKHRCHIHHYVYVASFPDNTRRLPGNHKIRRDEYEQEFAKIAQHPAFVGGQDRVILRVRDGREVDLGTPDEFEQAFHGIGEATGGSSGGGQWSFLFGYVPTDEALEPEYADRIAVEARDFRTAVGIRLTNATAELLDRIASLTA